MKYRLMADLTFDDEVTLWQLRDALLPFVKKAKRLVVANDVLDSGFVELHRCFHDETPARLCEVIRRIEVGEV